jgi:signal transduction histidine kinase/ligand-binding sensor domain-containing protein
MGYKTMYLAQRLIICWLVTMIVSLPAAIRAQDGNYSVRRFTSLSGLPSGMIKSIYQDSKGFIWVGTTGGLAKFDGYSFKVFSSDDSNSMPPLNITPNTLLEDAFGNIWVGSANNGLVILNRKTEVFTIHTFRINDKGSSKNSTVEVIYQDRSRTIWVGTADGLYQYDQKRQAFTKFSFAPDVLNMEVTSIIEDRQNRLLIGTNNGIYSVERKQQRCMPITIYENTTPAKLTKLITINGKLCFGINETRYIQEVSLVDLQTMKAIRRIHGIENLWILSQIAMSDSTIYLGTIRGVFQFHINSDRFYPVILPSEKISDTKPVIIQSITKDRNDNLWVGTQPGELFLYERKKASYKIHDLQYKGSKAVGTFGLIRYYLPLSSGDILLGTAAGTLYMWDTLTRDFRYMYHLYEKTKDNHFLRETKSQDAMFIMRILEDKNSGMWVTVANRGPVLYKKKDAELYEFYIPFKDSCRYRYKIGSWGQELYEDRNGYIWVGLQARDSSYSNFIRCNPMTGEVRTYRYVSAKLNEVNDDYISTIREDTVGNLWIASNGLFYFNTRTETFKHYLINENDLNDRVNVISRLKILQTGVLLLNTFDGVFTFDTTTKKFQKIIQAKEEERREFRSIYYDAGGTQWYTTKRGLTNYNPVTKQTITYSEKDGLPSIPFTLGLRSSDGYFIAATTLGIISFHPDSLSSKKTYSPLAITSFTVSDKLRFAELDNNDTVELRYDENDFAVSFAALDYLDKENFGYKYKLEGFQDKWIQIKNSNTAIFNNIPSGDYVLRIQSVDSSRKIGAQVLAVRIIIHPPLWGTWWFRMSGGLIIIFTLVGLFVRRERSRTKYYRDLDIARENERIDLASELHDGPLQDLFAAHYLIDPIESDVQSEKAKNSVAKLGIILQKVRNDLRQITGELQMPNFENGFAEELRLSCEAFADKHPSLKVMTDIQDSPVQIPSHIMNNLYRIFRTALSNIGNHANARTVQVNFTATESELLLEIHDDGIGFSVPDDPAAFIQKKHYGLFMMHRFAETIKAKCSVLSEQGSGTTVLVNVRL